MRIEFKKKTNNFQLIDLKNYFKTTKYLNLDKYCKKHQIIFIYKY